MDARVASYEDDQGRAHTENARFFEYSSAANPIRAGLTPRLPFRLFPAALYADGPSRVIPLDLSDALKCESPATSPGLCASFIRILAGDAIQLDPNATSLVFYVIAGRGSAMTGAEVLDWRKGDFFTIPGASPMTLSASADAALYYVNDAPLLTYLGATADRARFAPTLYTADRANAELALVANDPSAADRSRISVLLADSSFPLTRTVSHTLWAMYGLITPGSVQRPHRHQSVALDFIAECDGGCFSMVGQELDPDGAIRNPTRVDWEAGSVFITPPGYWHAHHNTSSREARLIPIQDAGLQTYLRTLDIRFS